MDYVFLGEICESKALYNVFKAICFKEYAIIRIMEEGFKVTVEDMKCSQNSAYIPSDVFTKYSLNADEDCPEKFRISLQSLTEFLNIFGDDSNHSLKIMYKSAGSPLCLLLTNGEENIIVDAEIVTTDPDEIPEIILPESENINNIVIQTGSFMNLLSELESSSDILEIITSPDPPFFQISAIGTMGDSQVEISKFSEIIDCFSCSNVIKSQYFFNNLKQLMKILSLSNKVSISTNPDGILGVQVIVGCENETKIYVEYFVKAMIED